MRSSGGKRGWFRQVEFGSQSRGVALAVFLSWWHCEDVEFRRQTELVSVSHLCSLVDLGSQSRGVELDVSLSNVAGVSQACHVGTKLSRRSFKDTPDGSSGEPARSCHRCLLNLTRTDIVTRL